MAGENREREITDELVDAFVRLARGDFSVRLARNYKRDTDDTLAFFVNLIAEELDRLLRQRERELGALEHGVKQLSEAFLGLAAGNFAVRAPRSEKGDPIDVLAFLFNNTVVEVGDAFSELERQRTVHETILESMIDGVVVLDAWGMIQRINGALASVLGFDAEALIGQPFDAILAPTEHELTAQLPAVVPAGEFRDRDIRFSTSGGEPIVMAVNGSSLRDARGALTGVVLVARDDRALRQARAQLQLADRMATMGTLAAGVAHEINNPLAFVIANLDFVSEELQELLEAGKLDRETGEELLRAVKSSHGGADRVRQIVRDLKTFSRHDESTIARLDLGRVVTTSLNMLRNEVRHHARLVTDLGEAPAVLADEARLGQVVMNLVQNAAHAIPLGHAADNLIRVTISTTPTGEACVEVRDTGVGIAAADLPRIFDAFYTTKAVGVGTGLGLSISHKIVSSAGGRIEVSSELNRGSCFRIVLPAAPPEEGEARAVRAHRERESGRRLRILVVDDEVEIGEAVERMLGREHDLEIVAGADAAHARLAEAHYDVVLCDLLMPETSGMELYLRLADERPALLERFVFMSGGAFDPGAREFLHSVPNIRIDKPFTAVQLRDAVVSAARSFSG